MAKKTQKTSRLAGRYAAPNPVVNPVEQAEVDAARAKAEATPRMSGLAGKLRQPAKTSTPPHVIVEARAGTGKTTTLVEGLKRLKGLPVSIEPSPQQAAVWEAMEQSKDARTVCFCCFNRSIKDELARRVPAGCEATTMHSMGYKAVSNAFGLKGYKAVSEWVVPDLIAEIVGKDLRELKKENFELVKATQDLVSLCKVNLIDPSGEDAEELLDRLSGHYGIELNGSRSEVYELVPKVLERCKEPQRNGRIDYDDMIWLPVVLNLYVPRYDLLLVDEAQDLNRCQQALAKRAGERLILCGDPRQAIYGFAGADAESMPRMARELGETERGCITLPLTVTRRCGKAIVAEANKIVAEFSAHESNPAGTITRRGFKPAPESCSSERLAGDYRQWVMDGDMVLCRVNAPLVSECFRFIKAGRKANIQGRDIGAGLIKTINKLVGESDDLLLLIDRLSDWLAAETAKENAKRYPSESRLIQLQDRHDCLMAFTEGSNSVTSVRQKIDRIFTDDKDSTGIRLSSIHKAKGLEARRVFLLEPERATVPHPMAKSAWEVEQEWNLRYVAITRAIEELVYVS